MYCTLARLPGFRFEVGKSFVCRGKLRENDVEHSAPLECLSIHRVDVAPWLGSKAAGVAQQHIGSGEEILNPSVLRIVSAAVTSRIMTFIVDCRLGSQLKVTKVKLRFIIILRTYAKTLPDTHFRTVVNLHSKNDSLILVRNATEI